MYVGSECVRALKGPVPPRGSYSGKIALSGSCRPRSTLAGVPARFAHTAVTVADRRTCTTPIRNATVSIFALFLNEVLLTA